MVSLKERIDAKLKRINDELGRKPRLTKELWNNIDCFRGHESQPEGLVYVKVGRGLIVALIGDVDDRGWHNIRTLDSYPNHRITYLSELYMILDKLIDNLDKSSTNAHSKKDTVFQQINDLLDRLETDPLKTLGFDTWDKITVEVPEGSHKVTLTLTNTNGKVGLARIGTYAPSQECDSVTDTALESYLSNLHTLMGVDVENTLNKVNEKPLTFLEEVSDIITVFGSMAGKEYLMNFLQEHAFKDHVTLLEELYNANTPKSVIHAEMGLNAIVISLQHHYNWSAIYHLSKDDFFNYVDNLDGKIGLVTLETIRSQIHDDNVQLAEVIGVTHTKTLKDTEVPRYLTEWLLEYYIGATVSLTSQKD